MDAFKTHDPKSFNPFTMDYDLSLLYFTLFSTQVFLVTILT